MKRTNNALRHALTGVALAVGLLCALPALALGLGRLNVQSALGESLRAEIDITSITAAEAESLQLRVASPEAYRAAGVEFNPALSGAQVRVVRGADGRTILRVTNDRAVLEPFIELIVEATWAQGRLVREYTMLFDPPASIRSAQAPVAPTTAPVVTAPAALPSPAVPRAAAPAPMPAAAPAPVLPARTAPAPAPTVAAAPATAPAPAPVANSAPDDATFLVQRGDTLSRIANRTQREGVSLDQMLVSLFRANPQAFMGENMNRLKSGVVLSVPSAVDAARVDAGQARDIINAQSLDFDAFRQRLAGGTTARPDAAPSRQATGRVQTQVQDQRQVTAPTPDKLTLSRPGEPASVPAIQASQEAERQAAANRVAELARNVEELRQLQAAGPGPAAAPAQAPAPDAAPDAAPPAPTVVAAASPVEAPVEASAVAADPAAVTPPEAAVPAPPTTAAAAEDGMFDKLLAHPMLLPGAGLLAVLLGGLGLYSLRSRRKQAGETSFLESRLQPDSFFGASGGQRIDTRETGNATGNSSSMSYSLSQLDAIGDVDPVAEADVYLAYGRDLQAEEILKEAMRSDPERLAVRTKLLEVYAKRRDIKGFELLATQLFSLTKGQGEDWSKAQSMGLSIDPENTLYQSGGSPEAVFGNNGEPVEPLSASTMPHAAPAGPQSFQPAADATLDASALDLSLDLELPQEVTQPQRGPAPARDSLQPAYEAELPTLPIPAPRPPAPPTPEVTELPDLSLDFETDTGTVRSQTGGSLDFDLGEPASAATGGDARLDFGDFGIEPEATGSGDPESDALSRKLELAEEFRQIGDLEGARDLLEEVLAKADGALRTKAQGMLDAL